MPPLCQFIIIIQSVNLTLRKISDFNPIMNISLNQGTSNVAQWKADIKTFAKDQKEQLKKNLSNLQCSNKVKLDLFKGFKETLKIKLSQVQEQRQRFESQACQEKDDSMNLVSEKDYLVISGRCLSKVDQLQSELLAKFQSLIVKKDKLKSQKKAELKSISMSKSKDKILENFFIPDTKMVSSVIINPKGNTYANKSVIINQGKLKKSNKDISLQLKSKQIVSKMYKSEMCSILEPILQEARQIFAKNKQLIATLKQGHKKQLELNLWIKQFKLVEIKKKLQKKTQELRILESEQKEEQTTNEKDNSDTTGSPDEKGTPSGLKDLISESKKIEFQSRKSLFDEEKNSQTNLIQKNEENPKSIELKNKQINILGELSPTDTRKMTSKIDRPSRSFMKQDRDMDQDEAMHLSSSLSNLSSKKMSSKKFSETEEVSKEEILAKLEQHQMILSESLKKSNQFNNENNENCRYSPKKIFMINNSNLWDQNSELSRSSRNTNRSFSVQNVIFEQKNEENSGSSDHQEEEQEQIFEKLLKQQQAERLKREQEKQSVQSHIKSTNNLITQPPFQINFESSKVQAGQTNQNTVIIPREIPQNRGFQKSWGNTWDNGNKENESFHMNSGQNYAQTNSSKMNGPYKNSIERLQSHEFRSSSDNSWNPNYGQMLQKPAPLFLNLEQQQRKESFGSKKSLFSRSNVSDEPSNIFKKVVVQSESAMRVSQSINQVFSKKDTQSNPVNFQPNDSCQPSFPQQPISIFQSQNSNRMGSNTFLKKDNNFQSNVNNNSNESENVERYLTFQPSKISFGQNSLKNDEGMQMGARKYENNHN